MMAQRNPSSPAGGIHSGINVPRDQNLGWLRTSVTAAKRRAPRPTAPERKLSAVASRADVIAPARPFLSSLARRRRLAVQYRGCPPEFVFRRPAFRAARHSENPPPEFLAWPVARIQAKWVAQHAPPSPSSPTTRACRHCPPTHRPSTAA